ncbi:recBCD enzyme subunit RecB, P-loop containing nucleoside triphosphate hydrolase [Artemisia annua]|uniref:RecBCD enzyme subunit RecB, P-loop containing nucleoside triphosphate hydrolase n=1 Tax=Artemisia annua TaxID=35608 RepID=A0A2U1P3X3_ARTAN|nr:recBCD enzyme subunit RecB, P-loop containing nucleoside triphosphate hydrolase [Artemisia annua]
MLLLLHFSELKALIDAFNPSPMHSVFRKNLENLMEWPERSKPKLDDFLKRYGKSQDPKSGQMVVSECSSSTTEVEQTGDESNIPDAKNKKAERNKGKKGKKGKEMSHGPDAWALGFTILTKIFIIPPNNDSWDVFTDKFKKLRTRMGELQLLAILMDNDRSTR